MCWIGKVWLFKYGSELLSCHNSTQAEGYCNLSCADTTVSMAMFRVALASEWFAGWQGSNNTGKEQEILNLCVTVVNFCIQK